MSITTLEPDSALTLTATVGVPSDAVEIFAQVSPLTYMQIGASDFLGDSMGGLLQFAILGGNYRKIALRLTAQGTYAAEVGHLDAHDFSWIIDAVITDINATELDSAVSFLAELKM